MICLLAILPWTFLWGGPQLGFGWLYWVTLAGVTLLLIYEHSLVRPDDLDRVNIAFFNVNSLISTGLLAAGTVDLLVI